MGDVFGQLSRVWKELGASQRVSLAMAGVAIIALTVGLLVWANRPRMQLLYGGLDSKDMGEISKAVDAMGITYEIRNGGSAIYVQSGEVYSARMQLAADGLPSGGGVGYEIFDSGSFGISSFVQHTNFVRAIQGELSRTINQINGIRSSKVLIVIPENELVIDGAEKKPTASVFVDTGGRTLAVGAVDSIRSLVSNAVESMNANDVAVVDNRGNVLSEALSDEGTLGGTSSQIKYRKSLEDYYTNKVESMLEKVVGPQNVVVRVSVGLDMDMQTLVEEQFDPDVQIVRSETTDENQIISNETSRASAVGEDANTGGGNNNVPDDQLLSSTNETKTTKDTQYEIAKTVIETVKNPGSISSLTAAVFLATPFIDDGQGVLQPQPRSEEQLDRIRLMVVNALGVEYATPEELEQKVTIEEMEFQTTDLTEVAGGFDMVTQLPMVMDLLKNGVAIGVSIFMLLFFFRLVKNASTNGSDQMEILPPEQEIGGGPAGVKDATPTVSPELLNELIKQNPDKVSSALKNWAFPDQ
ncbi:MAG: flagellar M-ring protein FliF [Opitutales bacterium]|nr:flagellar M-ring protein FliF [Opitutales bacterium]